MPSINDSKCVLVIGATAGIGRALALAIYKLPTNPTVIVAGRRQDRLDELVKQGDGRIHSLQVDVNKPTEELRKFVDGVVNKFPNVRFTFKSGLLATYMLTLQRSSIRFCSLQAYSIYSILRSRS